jgi:acyl-CoA reductase-like NAD-dependent aldehyde dehydrogenase
MNDADLDSVVEGVVDAIWSNQGQVCCAGSRLLVQEGIASHLEQKLRARMESLRGSHLRLTRCTGNLNIQRSSKYLGGICHAVLAKASDPAMVDDLARVWSPR